MTYTLQLPFCLALVAAALTLGACDSLSEDDPAPFSCEVPPPPTEPARFIAMGYDETTWPRFTPRGLVAGTTADGVTDTLTTYDTGPGSDILGVNGEFFFWDHHPRGGLASSARRVVDGAERSRLDVRAPDGTTRTLDFSGPDLVLAPRWRPDGDRVLFVRYAEFDVPESSLVEWDPATGATEILVTEPGAIDSRYMPAYAPDGRSVAYNVDPTSSHIVGDVAIISAETGARVQLGEQAGVRLSSPGFHPVLWSSNSRWVASGGERQVTADSVRDGFFAARADGSEVVELAYDSVAVHHLSGWLPGQDCLVFLDDRRRVHVGDLRGNSQMLSAERVPFPYYPSTVFARSIEEHYAVTPDGGRLVAFLDDDGPTLVVVDLNPFAVREVPLAQVGPNSVYRLADWVEE